METEAVIPVAPILLVFAMAGVGMKVPVQAAGNDAGAQTGEMKVHFLDVGQGLSILVQSEGKTMIYDGGDKKDIEIRRGLSERTGSDRD